MISRTRVFYFLLVLSVVVCLLYKFNLLKSTHSKHDKPLQYRYHDSLEKFHVTHAPLIDTIRFPDSNEVTLQNVRSIIEAQEKSGKPFHPIIVKRVLTDKEIDHIKQTVQYRQSETIGSDKNVYNNKKRDSWTGWYDNRELITKLVKSIDPSRSFEHCEQLQVVKYHPGGFFVPHFDTTPDPYSNYTVDFRKGGHRIYTMLISLTNPNEYEGGHTEFPVIGKQFKLEKGDGLVFRNIENDGNTILYESRHGGTSVLSGIKEVCNLWIHQNAYNYRN